MTKRCSRNYVHKLLEENPDWNVLDLGCGSDGFLRANVYADIEDYSDVYEKRFVQTQADDTPFEDKEFDFSISTHVAEHVPDPVKFLRELVRISKRGYIEVPTPMMDNMGTGNDNPPPHGHLWWVTFDDDDQYMDFKRRQEVMQPFMEARDTTYFLPFFRDSMVTGIYWENEIKAKVSRPVFTYKAGDSSGDVVIDLHNKEYGRMWTPMINQVDYMMNYAALMGSPGVFGEYEKDSEGNTTGFRSSPENQKNAGRSFINSAFASKRAVYQELARRQDEAQSGKNNK